jgi:hypothetical protein
VNGEFAIVVAAHNLGLLFKGKEHPHRLGRAVKFEIDASGNGLNFAVASHVLAVARTPCGLNLFLYPILSNARFSVPPFIGFSIVLLLGNKYLEPHDSGLSCASADKV